MIEIRRILCPVDFSDVSRYALEHAIRIAKWYESAITTLHVIEPPVIFPPPVFMTAVPMGRAPTVAERQSAEAELRTWLEPAARAGIATDMLFGEGAPASCILEHAKTFRPDLIVLGTHGRGGFDRVILGSVAERVLRKAPCPVMTVPPAAVVKARLPYTRILCPIDFSSSSLTALLFARSLAQESDAHLTLLHVFEWPSADDWLPTSLDVPEFRPLIEQEVKTRLDALITAEAKTWSKPAAKVAHGKPYRKILETAEAEGSDLIVMGVRGRNPVDLTLFGSTTNHVVRGASCPVVTVRD